jgi:LAO/AO transport system kinase
VTGLLDRFRRGDRRALSRLLSHVENQTKLGKSALKQLSSAQSDARILGLTGPPGAGKSTLANQLVREFRSREKTVAVLAIDPTSPHTGGATLGDRIRLLESQDDSGVYIRSMASRGQIGGLAIAAFGGAEMLGAFGFDQIIIETVGAGQDEVDIASLADTVVLLQTPGLGDSIQAVKAGILEIADIYVVNKADLPGADELARDLRQMVRMGSYEDWTPPVLLVSALDGSGVDSLVDVILYHQQALGTSCKLELRREKRAHFHARMLAIADLQRWLQTTSQDDMTNGDPVTRAERLLRAYVAERSRN